MNCYHQQLLEYFQLNEKNIKYNPTSKRKLIGLTHPQIAKFYKNVIKKAPKKFLIAFELDCYELQILYAHALGGLKDIDEALYFFDRFIIFAREWSVVDTLAQRFVIAKKFRSQVFTLLAQYAEVEDEFIQRTVAVTLLSHFLVDDYIARVISLLERLDHQGYYTKMGVSWALATIASKYPTMLIEYLELKRLDRWTHNKTIQKANESFRVSEEAKNILKTMKRKQ